ncbi:MAG: hypothetical protein NTX49_03820 [Chlamydiae bacterium]|nr:hypothetical protein [Chlamydiota bacterium]
MTTSITNLHAAAQAKCALAPSRENHDRLHPPHSYSILYREEGLWENRMNKTPEISFAIKNKVLQAHSATPFPSLDALCENQLAGRTPRGFRIGGIKGIFEKCVNCFFKIFGRSYTACTDSAKRQAKRQIAFSSTNRMDLRSKISIQDRDLRACLQVSSDDLLTTTHTFSKNSPLNGQSYINAKGETVLISRGISSSSDLQSPNIHNLRRVAAVNNTTIAYTGRVETKEKALEQASFIFFSEMRSKKLGIKETTSSSGEPLYTLNYTVNSLLATNPIMSTKIPGLIAMAERKTLIQERKQLKDLSGQGYLELTDPETGKKYKVQFKPILFADGLNFMQSLETSLPPDLTGADHNSSINKEGLNQIHTLVDEKLASLERARTESTEQTSPSTSEIEKKISEIQRAWDECLEEKSLLPELNILRRDYLFKLLDIPVVYHCKSSVDRTGIALAISSALKQWMDLGLEIPEPLSSLTEDFRFKELFVANLLVGHQITRSARSFEGQVNGKNDCPHRLGYKFSKGLFQYPTIHRLLPERYLQEYSGFKRAQATFAIIAIHILCIPLLAIKTLWNLGKWLIRGCKKENFPSWKHIFPLNIPHSISQALTLVPTRILKGSSPQVGKREILSSSTRKCSEFGSSCTRRARGQVANPILFSEAHTPKEYQKALADFKRDVQVGKTQTVMESTPLLAERLGSIKERRRLDPHCDITQDLAVAKDDVSSTLLRDLARNSLDSKKRVLIINGKRYGFAPFTTPKSFEELMAECRPQVQEIYDILKAFYTKTRPELALAVNALDLEEQILVAMDQLHQGGIASLQIALIGQFQTDQFFLSTNNSYSLELNIDPEEILPDGRSGSLLLKRRLIHESVSSTVMGSRVHVTPSTTNEYGISVFKEVSLKAEGFVFAETRAEIHTAEPMKIRFGVL